MRKTKLLEAYISIALLSSEVQYLPIYLLTCEHPYPIVIIFNTVSSLGILQIHCGISKTYCGVHTKREVC